MDCARCGGPNPPGATTCQWCSQQLEIAPPPATPTLEYQPLDSPVEAPTNSYAPGLYYRVGIPLLLIGIVALIGAAVVSSGVSSYNQTCAQIPSCVPQSDPSGGIAAIGVVLLLIGIVIIVYGATRPSY